MKLIVGLGNPGKKYENTRHNLGFMVLDKFLKSEESTKNSNWELKKDLKSEIKQLNIGSEKVILCRPQTFMNNSGLAVSLIANYYKILPEDIWVVNDEIDLPVGSLKIRLGGGSAGHHGVDSVMKHLGTDKFWRIRLGIGVSHHSSDNDPATGVRKPLGRQKIKHVDEFVLSTFGQHDKGKIRELIKHAVKALEMGLKDGIQTAQNRFNTK